MICDWCDRSCPPDQVIHVYPMDVCSDQCAAEVEAYREELLTGGAA